MDHARTCFIASGSSIAEGKTMARKILQQVDDVTAGAYPVHMDTEIRQPKVVETYCK